MDDLEDAINKASAKVFEDVDDDFHLFVKQTLDTIKEAYDVHVTSLNSKEIH